MFIACGLCALAAVSWAASIIIKDNQMTWVTHTGGRGGQPGNTIVKHAQRASIMKVLKTRISGSNTIYYTLGNDIYIGWVAALLALISGALFVCSGCREEEDDDEYDDPMVRFKLIN